MNINKLLWITPFLSFLCGYGLLGYWYRIDSLPAPSLIGLNLTQALGIISANSLNPRLLAETEDPDLEPGTIISQTPPAGQKIKPHQAIFLVVTKKPACPSAPYLIGKNREIIEEQLGKIGVKTRTYLLQSSYPKECCLAQHPQVGKPLSSRRLITYISSPKKKPVVVPDFKGLYVDEAQQFLTEHGIRPAIVHKKTIKKGHTCSFCRVTEQQPLAGSLVNMASLEDGIIELTVT